MDSNDAKLDYETILMIRAAWYYYMENYTQQNISTLLGVSRAKVIGLLEKARQTGVIQFRIRQDGDRRIKVEQDLISRFGLKDVFTVPGSDSLANLNESIAQAAAMYIIRRLEEGDFLNMGYGDTTSRVLNHLAMTAEKPLNVVSLTGGVGYYLPNARMSVVGIGSMSEEATILKNGVLNGNDFTILKLQGAVGDLLSHFMDRDGNLISLNQDRRLMSTSLEDLRKLENVIGVAGGPSKVDAILAALRGGYLDILIPDEDTARVLLERS